LPAVVADSSIVSSSRKAETEPAACWARMPVSKRIVRLPKLPLSITVSAVWSSDMEVPSAGHGPAMWDEAKPGGLAGPVFDRGLRGFGASRGPLPRTAHVR